MTAFTIILSHFMILFPAAYVLLVPERQQALSIDRSRARELTIQMLILTAVALLIWWLLFLFVDRSYWPWLGSLNMLAFFGLFFRWAMPIMHAKNPDWAQTPPHDLPQRAASLDRRQAGAVLPRWATLSVWFIWAAGLLSVVLLLDWSVLTSAEEAFSQRRIMGWTALLVTTSLVICPAVLMYALKLDRYEPQPMDPENSAELQRLYSCRRRQRAWLFIGLGWAMLACFVAFAVVMTLMSRGMISNEVETHQMLGWAGAIVGTVIGLGGGVAGTMSSIQAARINQRLRELTMQQEA